jgi:hypothetical protein
MKQFFKNLFTSNPQQNIQPIYSYQFDSTEVQGHVQGTGQVTIQAQLQGQPQQVQRTAQRIGQGTAQGYIRQRPKMGPADAGPSFYFAGL